MLAGILPRAYWRLTPTETSVLLQGHYARDMQIATLIAAFFNVNRDPKRRSIVKAEDLSVFKVAKEKKHEQTPEQQRLILETLTVMMGGEVTKDV